jgi:hypothetical protein
MTSTPILALCWVCKDNYLYNNTVERAGESSCFEKCNPHLDYIHIISLFDATHYSLIKAVHCFIDCKDNFTGVNQGSGAIAAVFSEVPICSGGSGTQVCKTKAERPVRI